MAAKAVDERKRVDRESRVRAKRRDGDKGATSGLAKHSLSCNPRHRRQCYGPSESRYR